MKKINPSNTSLSTYKGNRHRKFDAKQAKRHDFGKAYCVICDEVFTKYHNRTITCSKECQRENKRVLQRKYYEKNREKENEKSRKYRKENSDKINEYQRKYHKENPEKKQAYRLKYREKNRVKIIEKYLKQYADKKMEE